MRSFCTLFFILSWGALRVAWGRLGGVLGASRGDVACLGGVLGSPWGVWGVSWGPRRCMIAPRQRQDGVKTSSCRPLDSPRSSQGAARPRQDAPRAFQEGDISADLEARCPFHQISWNVLKVFVFQYFWASPSPLRASWWHLEASRALPGPTWRLLGASLVLPWGSLGPSWDPRRSETASRPAQDRFKTASRRFQDWPRSAQHGPDPRKSAS